MPRLEHASVLVLASASPRRRELLGWLVGGWVLDAAEIDERPAPKEAADSLVRRLALAKARAVGSRRPPAWVLGADTVVEIDGEVLGKPADAAAATAMLGRLAGREHRVSTGFALLAPGGMVKAAEVVVTRVRFRPLAPDAIAAYVASGEPEGKAGGYAIQGRGAGLIERIDGSLTNVIGLPLVEVGRVLEEAGLLDR
jgi:septum formation protein